MRVYYFRVDFFLNVPINNILVRENREYRKHYIFLKDQNRVLNRMKACSDWGNDWSRKLTRACSPGHRFSMSNGLGIGTIPEGMRDKDWEVTRKGFERERTIGMEVMSAVEVIREKWSGDAEWTRDNLDEITSSSKVGNSSEVDLETVSTE